MAKLFKPTYTTYTLHGKARTPDGQRVTSATPGAKRKEGKSKHWWGEMDYQRRQGASGEAPHPP
jgi:hypothetical protein